MRLGIGTSLFAAAVLALLTAPASADNRGIVFEPGNLLAGQISPGEAEDTFVFDGLEGSFFDAAVAGDKTGGLNPLISLLDPDGEEIDLTGLLKAKGAKAAVKKVPLPASGRYALVISGDEGTSGGYTVKTKVKAGKLPSIAGVVLAPYARGNILVPGVGGAAVSFSLSTVEGDTPGVPDVLTPNWSSMSGPWAGGLAFSEKGIKGKFGLEGPLGDYRLQIVNYSDQTLTYGAKLKVKMPKAVKATVTATDPEPRVTSLSTDTAQANDSVSVYGSGFVNGCKVYFGDFEAFALWVSDSEVTAFVPDCAGLLPVGVLNPDGQENPLPDAILVWGAAAVYPLFPPPVCLTDAEQIHVSGTSEFVAALSVNGIPATLTPSSVSSRISWDVVVALAPGDNELSYSGTTVQGDPFTLLGSFATVTRTSAIPADLDGIVADLPNSRAFVLDGTLHAILEVSLTDGWRTVVSSPTIGTGADDFEPRHLAYDATGGRILCTDPSYGLIGVDLVTGNRTVISSNTVGSGPQWSWPAGVAVNAAGTTAWVSAENGGQIFQVSLASGARTIVSSDAVGSGTTMTRPTAMTLNGAGTHVLVTDSGQNAVFSVDLGTGDRTVVSGNSVGTGPLWSQPTGLTLDTPGNRVFVTDQFWRALYSADLGTGNRTLVSMEGTGTGLAFSRPTGVAYDADTGLAYVTDAIIDGVLSVDVATGNRSAFSTAFVGGGDRLSLPAKLTVDSGGYTLFVTEVEGRAVYTVDPANGDRTLLGDISHGSGGYIEPVSLMYGGSIGPGTDWLVVGSGGKIVGMDVWTGDRTDITGGGTGTGPDLQYPNGLCWDTAMGRILATTGNQQGVFSVDYTTGERIVVSDNSVGTGPTYYGPCGIAYNQNGAGSFLVTDQGNDTIFQMDRATGDRFPLAGWGAGSGAPIEKPRGICMAGDLFVVANAGYQNLLLLDALTGDRTILSGAGVGDGPVTANPEDVLPWPSNHGLHAVVTADYARGALIVVHLRSGDRVIVSK